MNRRRFSTVLPGLAFAAAASTAAAARADTDLVRELAKNKPPVIVVTSGEAAGPTARRLADAIRGHKEFGKRPVSDLQLVPLAEAAAAVAKSPRRPSVVFVLAGKDGVGADAPAAADPAATTSAGAPAPSTLLPFDPAILARKRLSVAQTVRDSDKAGEVTFRVGLFAPDAARLGRVADELLARRVEDFRNLPWESRRATNRVLVFSPPGWEKTLEGWGRLQRADTWDEVRRLPLADGAKLTPEEREEATEVYLIDRSRIADADIPAPAARALAPYTARDTTIIVARGEEEGRPVVAISAPSRTLLFSRIDGFPTVASLSAHPATKEVLNLTRVGTTSLIVLGAGGRTVAPELLASVHERLARTLREEYHVAVEPRGPVLAKLEADLALQMARGAEGTQGMLQRRYPTRYVWSFTITEAGGGVAYTPEERRLSSPPTAFTLDEPARPARKKDESDEDFEERRKRWRDRWDTWDRSRRDYQWHWANDSVEWELSVKQDRSARVRGLLQLIDTKSPAGARVVWEREASADEAERRVHRSQRGTVRGYDARPGSLDTPAAVEQAPSDLLLAAAVKAGTRGMEALTRDAVLPETPPPAAPPSALIAGEIVPAASPAASADARPAPAAVLSAKIADIDGKTVTLNAGANRGLRVGDRVETLLRAKEVKDPDTGRVLRVTVYESLFLTVTHVDAETADCAPATPEDAAKLARARVGLAVRRAAPGATGTAVAGAPK